MAKVLMFTRGGYDFWQDDEGLWNVVPHGMPEPKHCAYASAEPIAKLKGVKDE